jgi:hypothetical protein
MGTDASAYETVQRRLKYGSQREKDPEPVASEDSSVAEFIRLLEGFRREESDEPPKARQSKGSE